MFSFHSQFMKKKQLEILLQNIPQISDPKPHLEQYQTSASIAADILFLAYQFDDIVNKTICDLGCGTGLFAIGAALIGAKTSSGIDIDQHCITQAKQYAKAHQLAIDFITQDVANVTGSYDTVFMNPPFGAQKSNLQADRRFLEKACSIAGVIYSLHLSETIPFVEKLLTALQCKIYYHKTYDFPIKWQFEFHTKPVKSYRVSLIRICHSQ